MSDTSRPLAPTDRIEVLAVLDAMKRQIDLLGWHVKEIRNDGGVTEELNSGLGMIENAIGRMRKLAL